MSRKSDKNKSDFNNQAAARPDGLSLAEHMFIDLQEAITKKDTSRFKEIMTEDRLDLTMLNDEGENLVQIALRHKRLKMAQLLIDAGVNINHQDKKGHTALHHAAKKRQNRVARFLINQGADTQIQDEYKRRAVYFAAQHMNLDGFKVLFEATKKPCLAQLPASKLEYF